VVEAQYRYIRGAARWVVAGDGPPLWCEPDRRACRWQLPIADLVQLAKPDSASQAATEAEAKAKKAKAAAEAAAEAAAADADADADAVVDGVAHGSGKQVELATVSVHVKAAKPGMLRLGDASPSIFADADPSFHAVKVCARSLPRSFSPSQRFGMGYYVLPASHSVLHRVQCPVPSA
jgi:hypothetical protein